MVAETVYYDNAVVDGALSYEYDALYRLIQAQGREAEGQSASSQCSILTVLPILPGSEDLAAVSNYTEQSLHLP